MLYPTLFPPHSWLRGAALGLDGRSDGLRDAVPPTISKEPHSFAKGTRSARAARLPFPIRSALSAPSPLEPASQWRRAAFPPCSSPQPLPILAILAPCRIRASCAPPLSHPHLRLGWRASRCIGDCSPFLPLRGPVLSCLVLSVPVVLATA